jgi:hypothetical protein
MKNPPLSFLLPFLRKLGLLLLLSPRLFAETVQLPYSLTPGISYVGVPLLRPALFSGKITKADPSNFRLQVNSFPPIDFATVPGWGTSPCFLEVSAAPSDATLEGERYEVDPVRTLKEKGFVVVKSSPYNTRADLPSGLADASFSIHPHWTLTALFGNATTTALGKGLSAAASDEIRLYDPTATSGYRSFFPRLGDSKNLPGWRLSSNPTGPEQSETVFPPGYGMILVRNAKENLTFAVSGEPRTHAFRFPLRAGTNLLAPGHMKDFSLKGLLAIPSNGFVAGLNPESSDQVSFLVGERKESFSLLADSPARWVSLQSRYSLPPAEVVIAPTAKALEVRKLKADPDFVIPYVP